MNNLFKLIALTRRRMCRKNITGFSKKYLFFKIIVFNKLYYNTIVPETGIASYFRTDSF